MDIVLSASALHSSGDSRWSPLIPVRLHPSDTLVHELPIHNIALLFLLHISGK